MKKVTLWHNPRCTKSRQTLNLLQAHDTEVEIVEYLRNPPAEADIERALALLGLEPRQLMRREEPDYATLQLDDPRHTRAQLIRAMHTHPILIQRPIVFANNQARIGRPPESVLEIL